MTGRRIILVTSHRRENFGEALKNICMALKEIALIYPELDIVYPVHLNPNVRKPVYEILSSAKNIYLLEPLDYESFVYLMYKSYIILTDSGRLQEEAPSLGKPVLVMHNTTERPKAVEAEIVRLVGTNKKLIINEVQKLLNNETEYYKMSSTHNPYGDGKASNRIVKIISDIFYNIDKNSK